MARQTDRRVDVDDAAECALGWLARMWDGLKDSDPVQAERILAAARVVERVRAEVRPVRAAPRRVPVLAG